MKHRDYKRVDTLDNVKEQKGVWTVTQERRANIIALAPYVVFSCDQCGKIHDLASYNVSIKGKINPAIYCNECSNICWVTLEGYDGQEYDNFNGID